MTDAHNLIYKRNHWKDLFPKDFAIFAIYYVNILLPSFFLRAGSRFFLRNILKYQYLLFSFTLHQ